MIEYIEKEYGREYVGQIITFQRMAAKGAIRAAGRAWNIPYEVADKIAKMIPPEQGIEIKEVFDIKPEFKQAYDNDEVVRKMINTAMALEGLPSNPSTHAAGVLISPHKLVGNLPMWMNRGAGGETTIVCQYDMNKLEQLGYLKMDFLGLSTLTVIGDTLKFIKINHGITIEYQKLIDGLGDKPETYALMAKGDTQGVFQLEGAGMTTTAIKMQVANFNEATALVALYRPGPMDYIPAYIKNKQNPKDIDVPFDELRTILADTYGILVYQEQVTLAARDIAGYSMADGDSIRKAIGKKLEALIKEHREYFTVGKKDKDGNVVIPGGIVKYSADKLYNYYDNTIVPFGRYAFNKSHAAAYARIAEMTAWLKLEYPVEYMAALIESAYHSTGDKKKRDVKVKLYTNYCKSKGIGIIPPDINKCFAEFIPLKEGDILFGLSAIKGVGSAAAKVVEDRNENGEFLDAIDFFNRMGKIGVSRSAVEGLVVVGALDSMGIKRSEALAVMDRFLDNYKKGKPYGVENIPELAELDKFVLLNKENQYTGVYLTGHPLDMLRSSMEVNNNIRFGTIEEEDDIDRFEGKRYQGISLITGVKEHIAKSSKKLMAFLEVEDLTGTAQVTMFHKTYSEFKDIIKSGSIVMIRGRWESWEDKLSLIPDLVRPYSMNDVKQKVYVRIKDADSMITIRDLIVSCPGKNPVILGYDDMCIPLPKEFWVSDRGIELLGMEFDIVRESPGI